MLHVQALHMMYKYGSRAKLLINPNPILSLSLLLLFTGNPILASHNPQLNILSPDPELKTLQLQFPHSF